MGLQSRQEVERKPVCAEQMMFTVDTEPDWGMEGIRGVKEVLPRLLQVLGQRRMAATFYVTARLLETCGEELLRIGPQHEIASHGLTHRRMDQMPAEELRTELRGSKLALERFFGRKVSGVRAPFFATPAKWIVEAAAAGYSYDASVGCVRPSFKNHGLYKPRGETAARAPKQIPQLGVSTFRDGLTPCCLTYLRLYHPFGLWLAPRSPRMFYMHLHELLPAETAAGLKMWVRLPLTRNCGERAWRILGQALDRFSGEWVTCSDFLRNREDAWTKR